MHAIWRRRVAVLPWPHWQFWQFCYRFGARLVEPAGYVLSEKIVQEVNPVIPDATYIWTGLYSAWLRTCIWCIIFDVKILRRCTCNMYVQNITCLYVLCDCIKSEKGILDIGNEKEIQTCTHSNQHHLVHEASARDSHFTPSARWSCFPCCCFRSNKGFYRVEVLKLAMFFYPTFTTRV